MIIMGLKFIEHEPVDFEKVDYKSKILDEIENGRELNALFFIHSYIEGYLTQLIIDALEACNELFEIYKNEMERKGEQK